MAENQNKKPFLLAGKRRLKMLTIAICLVLATVFWFFNALNNDYSAIIHYPVKIIYNTKEYQLDAHTDKYVKVSATGYGWYLLYYSLGLGIGPLELNLENHEGSQYVPDSKLLELAKMGLKNVEVNKIVSDTFKIEAAPLVKKKLYLKLDTKRLSLPKGKTIDQVTIDPLYITCSGPKKELITLPDTISFALPDTFIEGEEFSDDVHIAYHPSKNIRPDISSVKVSFTLK